MPRASAGWAVRGAPSSSCRRAALFILSIVVMLATVIVTLVVLSRARCCPARRSPRPRAARCAPCSVCLDRACGGVVALCVSRDGTAPRARRQPRSSPSCPTSVSSISHPAAGGCLAVLFTAAAVFLLPHTGLGFLDDDASEASRGCSPPAAADDCHQPSLPELRCVREGHR